MNRISIRISNVKVEPKLDYKIFESQRPQRPGMWAQAHAFERSGARTFELPSAQALQRSSPQAMGQRSSPSPPSKPPPVYTAGYLAGMAFEYIERKFPVALRNEFKPCAQRCARAGQVSCANALPAHIWPLPTLPFPSPLLTSHSAPHRRRLEDAFLVVYSGTRRAAASRHGQTGAGHTVAAGNAARRLI